MNPSLHLSSVFGLKTHYPYTNNIMLNFGPRHNYIKNFPPYMTSNIKKDLIKTLLITVITCNTLSDIELYIVLSFSFHVFTKCNCPANYVKKCKFLPNLSRLQSCCDCVTISVETNGQMWFN